MTLEQARTLREGMRIASRFDVPAFRIRRVTHVWANPGNTIVLVALASYGNGAWISPDGFDIVPAGATGCLVEAGVARWYHVSEGVRKFHGEPIPVSAT